MTIQPTDIARDGGLEATHIQANDRFVTEWLE